jgi:hypothetical protein
MITEEKVRRSIVKVVGYRHSVKEVAQTVRWIAQIGNPEKDELELEKSDGEIIKGKEAIAALIEEWKTDFERGSKNRKNMPRHATHIMLIADCEPTEMNYRKLEKATFDLLQREFAWKDYDYVFVVHKDSQHPHVHVVIKNKQREMGLDKRRKLQLNPSDLLHLRQQFAYELENNNL